MTIWEIVERFRSLPGAMVDVSFRQGKEAILQQRKLYDFEGADIDQFIVGTQERVRELEALIAPYHLPDDYRTFLEYFGGASIDTEQIRFQVLGIGAMASHIYESVLALNEIMGSALRDLHIGDVARYRRTDASWQGVTFLIDIAGTVQPHSIIALGPNETEDPSPFWTHPDDKREWRKIATSFTEWLELAVQTGGSFEYT
jgi:hypothetical protein